MLRVLANRSSTVSMQALRAAGFAAIVLAVSTPTARADAIDGDWCFATQNLNIQGPRIRTPGGNEMQGDYSRHTFNYVVPGNEAGAGSSIAMQLLSEEHMQLTRGGTGAPEVWRRCKPIS